MLAIKYEPYESDSVVGALIHFAPTPIDVSNNLFLLTLWDDNGGVPGAILYQDNSFSLANQFIILSEIPLHSTFSLIPLKYLLMERFT
jgi:hypothetical protein